MQKRFSCQVSLVPPNPPYCSEAMATALVDFFTSNNYFIINLKDALQLILLDTIQKEDDNVGLLSYLVRLRADCLQVMVRDMCAELRRIPVRHADTIR